MRKVVMLSGAALAMSLLAATPVFATSNTKNDDHKIGVCHATGSKTNPFVYIYVDKHAAEAHARHQDGRDVIGVKSAKDCPKAATTPSPSPKPSPSPSPKPGQGGGQVLSTATGPQPTELPKTGAGLSALIGLPSLAVAGRAYLRSRTQR